MPMKIPPPQYRPSEHAVLNGAANLQRDVDELRALIVGLIGMTKAALGL